MPQVKQITSPPPEDTGGADTDEEPLDTLMKDPPVGAVTTTVLVKTSTGCEGPIVIVAPDDRARCD
jgi:hypothetical protein